MKEFDIVAHRWLLLAGVWALYFGFGLVAQSMAPLTLTLVDELGISLSEMGRILGAWQLVFLFCSVPLGLAIDRVGLVWALFLAACIIAASALLRAFAVDAVTLWLAVAVFGFGGPLISVGAPKVISACFSSDERGMAMGIYMTGPGVGGIVSLALTNSVLMPLFDYQWRWVFVLFSGIVLVAGIAWIFISRVQRSLLQATHANKAANLSTFAELLRIPIVQIILVMSILVFIYSHGLGNWLPAILREKGFSTVEAGYWAAIPTLIGIAGSLLIPRYARGARRYLILNLVCASACLSVLGLWLLEGNALLVALVAMGVARSTMMTLCILVLMETPSVGARYMGSAGGLFFTCAEIGGVAGPASIGYLRDLTGSFSFALSALFAISICLLVMSLWTHRLSR